MARCNELCTKDATGNCAVCEARSEADRFFRFWFQGGLFVDGMHAMQKRGVFVLLHRYVLPLAFLFAVGFLLWLAWFIPRSVAWHSTLLRFVHENPVFVVVLIISLVVPLFWLFLWKLPQWQVAAVPEVKDRIDLESKSRQTLAQILGGAALLVGLYFTSQTLRITQEGQITDRFTKAIDQLGKDTLAVRLGGIYALERIATDSERDHFAVMEVLTAFVRENPYEQPGQKPKDPGVSKPSPDVQTILTVIGRRTRTFGKRETKRLNLRRTHLEGIDLRGAHLEGIDLRDAHLEGAFLAGAHLEGAFLAGAHLEHADFAQALSAGTTLAGIIIESAIIDVAHLEGAFLAGAHLEHANLTRAHLEGAFLAGAHLEHANLAGAHLEEAYLARANLKGAFLIEAYNLTQEQINTACLDEETQLPAGLTRPAPCPTKP